MRRVMATPKQWVKDDYTPDLCITWRRQFCNSCQVSLCDDCVDKHRNELKHPPCDIVYFKAMKIAFPPCQKHGSYRCMVSCQSCHIMICNEDVSRAHQGHKIESLARFVERKKQNVELETAYFESQVIPNYKRDLDGNVKKKISHVEAGFKRIEKQRKELKILWHKEVDDIFNKFEILNQSVKDKNLAVLRKHQTLFVKMKDLMAKMTQHIPVCSNFLKEIHDDSDLDKQEYNVAQMMIEENATTGYFRANIIRNYENVSDVEYSICRVKTQYEVNKDDFENQRTIWHQKTEDIFNQLGFLNQSLKDKNMGILTSHETRWNILISNLAETAQQNKRVLQSDNVEEIMKLEYLEHHEAPEQIDIEISSLCSNVSKGEELSVEIRDFRATLTQNRTNLTFLLPSL